MSSFPVRQYTEADIRKAHDEGRLKVPLNVALQQIQTDSPTHLHGVIEPTEEEKEAAVRYSPLELVQIIQYIGTLLPKLPPELQEHTDNEHKIVMRTPYILQLNPNLNHFQANYTGLFVSTLRYMSEPEKLEEFVNRVRNIGSMYMQGYSGKEAAAQLKKL